MVGYRVYCEGTLVCDIAATATWVVLPELVDGNYTATAYDSEGVESVHSEPFFAVEGMLAGYYFNALRMDYDSEGKPAYRGQHTDQNASPDDGNWVITKYYYDENGMLVMTRVRTTSWTLRGEGW